MADDLGRRRRRRRCPSRWSGWTCVSTTWLTGRAVRSRIAASSASPWRRLPPLSITATLRSPTTKPRLAMPPALAGVKSSCGPWWTKTPGATSVTARGAAAAAAAAQTAGDGEQRRGGWPHCETSWRISSSGGLGPGDLAVAVVDRALALGHLDVDLAELALHGGQPRLDRGRLGLELLEPVGGQAGLGLVLGQRLLALAQDLEPLADPALELRQLLLARRPGCRAAPRAPGRCRPARARARPVRRAGGSACCRHRPSASPARRARRPAPPARRRPSRLPAPARPGRPGGRSGCWWPSASWSSTASSLPLASSVAASLWPVSASFWLVSATSLLSAATSWSSAGLDLLQGGHAPRSGRSRATSRSRPARRARATTIRAVRDSPMTSEPARGSLLCFVHGAFVLSPAGPLLPARRRDRGRFSGVVD